MATDNLFEVVDRLETAVARFERMFYGEPPERPNGLVSDVKRMADDMQALHTELQCIQARRPTPWIWVGGYLTFMAAMFFNVVGVVNLIPGHDVLDIPPGLALGLAFLLGIGALLLLMAGFGWLNGRA